MPRSIVIAVALLGLCLMPTGCAKKVPPIVYEPPLTMADLLPGQEAPDNSFELLAEVHTTGRFACGMAIAKFFSEENDDGPTLTLLPLTSAEQARWTEQMRGVSAIRELTFLRPRNVRLDGPAIENLCAAAARLESAVLLVYAPNGLGPNSAQVYGVLYDTPSREPLAVLHTSSLFLDDEGLETSPDECESDEREVDARYQAQRHFEEQVLLCLRELIHEDKAAPTTQPHKWEKPFIERWWVPQRHR